MIERVNRTMPTEPDDWMKLDAVTTRGPRVTVGDDDVADVADYNYDASRHFQFLDDDHDLNGTCSLLPLLRFHAHFVSLHPVQSPNGPWGVQG